MTEQITALARAMGAEGTEELLTALCRAAEDSLRSRLRTLTPPHSRTILAMAASITGMASRMERYVTVSAPCRGT